MGAVLTLLLMAVPAQSQARQYLPPLDRSATKRVLREAEKQLAAFRLDHAIGSSGLVEHRGNPLARRICEFRCRFKMTTLTTDLIPKRGDPSEFIPTRPVRTEHDRPSDRYIIVATIKASMSGPYKFKAFYPERSAELDRNAAAESRQRKDKNGQEKSTSARRRRTEVIRQFERRVAGLRHQIHLMLPPGFRPPAVMPRNFDAIVAVKSVHFDGSDSLPTFTIYGSLLKSDKLRFDAAKVIRQIGSPDAKQSRLRRKQKVEAKQNPPNIDDEVECLYVHVTGSDLEIGNCDEVPVVLISLAIDGKYVLKIPDESELLGPDEEVVIALSSIPRFPVDDWRRLKYQMRVVQLLTDHGEFTFHPERLP